MELKIKVNAITIKDENTGEEYTVKTVRTVKEIWEFVDETEKDFVVDKASDLVGEYR